jgi:hypothetical protein
MDLCVTLSEAIVERAMPTGTDAAQTSPQHSAGVTKSDGDTKRWFVRSGEPELVRPVRLAVHVAKHIRDFRICGQPGESLQERRGQSLPDADGLRAHVIGLEACPDGGRQMVVGLREAVGEPRLHRSGPPLGDGLIVRLPFSGVRVLSVIFFAATPGSPARNTNRLRDDARVERAFHDLAARRLHPEQRPGVADGEDRDGDESVAQASS